MKIGVLPEDSAPGAFRTNEWVSKNAARCMCRRLTHIKINRSFIQKLALRVLSAVERAAEEAAAGWFDGPLGIGNVLPFSRVQNKFRAPDSINYPIPCVGAHTRTLSVWKVNYVPNSFSAAQA